MRLILPGMETAVAKPSSIKNVFVVDDSLPIRARVVEMLREIDGVNVVGEASTPADAVVGIVRTLPQFVVLDFQLEGGKGTDVLRMLSAQMPDMVFIVLTNYSQPQIRRACLDAGADAFFDKSTEMEKVKQLIAGGSSA